MDIKGFKGALAQIAEERGISPERVIETIEAAIATAYKKDYGEKGQKILHALEQGKGRDEDIENLERHCNLLAPGNTFCALAPGAIEPLQSALKYFHEDFERHVWEKKCPWK